MGCGCAGKSRPITQPNTGRNSTQAPTPAPTPASAPAPPRRDPVQPRGETRPLGQAAARSASAGAPDQGSYVLTTSDGRSTPFGSRLEAEAALVRLGRGLTGTIRRVR